jgi:hypothetical protein
MHKNSKIIVVGIGIIVALLFFGIFVFHNIKKSSDAKIDTLLKKLNEGTPFSKVVQILGEPNRTLTNQNEVKEWGTIEDSHITTECNLHMFLRMDVIPHKYILVYEDKKNKTVRLVTTKGT